MNTAASEKLSRFISLLEGIFELDKADLDFGIYRIMNIRRDKIKQFLSAGLPKKVQEALTPFAADTASITKRIAEIEKQANDLEIEITASPKLAEEYARLKSQLASGTDLSSLETDVYSALYSFFNRYYDEGDFISKRRYKEGVYAIPYEGEEVKLYWANHDQYYIKTTENFRDYTFIDNGKKVHFRLVDATTEKNNNKESDSGRRAFMLYAESAEIPEIKTIEEIDGELAIRFIYDVPADKRTAKQYADDNLSAITDIIKNSFKKWLHLFAKASDAKDEERSVIQKHLNAYTAKNTFDYFIHKNLRGFLTRELDFFIKSEVIHLDDLDTTDEKRADSYLAKVRAIKRVGKIIIDFLAQIEDFQKKLWLKKKFVVSTNWCITIDRIDEIFYAEIIANAAQIAEWKEMYAIDEIEGDLINAAYSEPLTIEFLRQNSNLIVDTRHFTTNFKERLIASIDDLDEQTGGLLIHSENFQALRLMTKKYDERIDGIYIDPPYNTSASEIIYKNGYRSSSWMSMLSDRLSLGKELLKDTGLACVTIDDFQFHELYYLLNMAYGEQHHFGTVIIKNNPQGRSSVTGFQIAHEYGFFYGKVNSRLGRLDRNENQLARYNLEDEKGPFEWRNFRAQYSQESATMVYPIFVKKNGNDFRIPSLEWNSQTEKYDINEEPMDDEIVTYPIDETGRMRTWKWSIATVESVKETEMGVRNDRSGTPAVYYKGRMKELGMLPFTLWDKPEYSASTFGANVLADIMGKGKFSYPKSIHAVEDCLIVQSCEGMATVLDYFAGSGTTGHAVLNLNRADGGSRKYILVEMGEYFHTVTLPRMKKVIYSADWKNGKPQNRNTGASHIMKYIALESYEDALSNIKLDDNKHELAIKFGDDYLLHYMLNYEAQESMLALDAFAQPFDYQLFINENNETQNKTVDICETFNYLVGLSVTRQSAVSRFHAVVDENGEYEGAVKLELDDKGEYSFKQIEGRTPDDKRALIIWRTITQDLLKSNAALDAYFTRHRINPADREFDVILVNGDNNLENLRPDNETWKVRRIEPVFKEKMFEEA